MSHYVLSSKVDIGCPLSLASEAFLYDKYHDPSKRPEDSFGSLPWYDEPETCALPEKLFLISKQSKPYSFDVRSIKKNIFVVSDGFLASIRDFGFEPEAVSRVEVFNKKGANASNKEYFAIKLPILSFESAVDASKSAFSGRPGRITLKKLKVKDNISFPIFLIDDLIGIQTTLICLSGLPGKDIKGVAVFEDTKAKWQEPFDFLQKQGGIINDSVVWPV